MKNNEQDCGCDHSENGGYQLSGWAPPGSTLTVNPDNSLNVTGPATDWVYIGYDKNYNLVESMVSTSLTIVCTCSKATGGCIPYWNSDGGYGCIRSLCGDNCYGWTIGHFGGDPIDMAEGGF